MAVETKQDVGNEDCSRTGFFHQARKTFVRVKELYGAALVRVEPFYRPVADKIDEGLATLNDTAVVRFVTSNLLRRIVASNLLGLAVLFLGVLYLSQFNIWLIDAKREALESQGRIISGAIASSLTIDDAYRADGLSAASSDDDPFADIMFSLGPERVTPVLRRLLSGTSNRARVYDKSGNVVADSIRLLPPGGLLNKSENGQGGYKPKTKNLWTRMREWFLGTDLKVYKELRHANGQLYPEVRTALKGKTEALLLLTRSGKQIVSVATPIMLANKVQGVLLLSTRPGEVDEALEAERLGVFALAIIAFCAAMLASYVLARMVAGPMRELSEAAENITRDIKAAEELPRFGDREDEVGQLARSFRSMTTALYRRINASERFAADVAHELKNPLTAARSTAEAMAYAKTDEQRDMLVEQIQEELQRLNRLITDVSNASRMDAELALHSPEPVNLAEIAKAITETFQDIISDTGKKLELVYDTSAMASGAYVVSGHGGRLAQVLTNLIDNALSFSPDDGVVKVRVRRHGGQVELTVTDQGAGIEPDKLEQIFTRFYTYRPTELSSRGNNSGLGLSISSEIVQAHGGEIWAENLYRKGSAGDADAEIAGAKFTVLIAASDTVKPAQRRLRRAAAAK